MGSIHISRIEDLLQRSGAASEPELKSALVRLSVELRERLAVGSPASQEFFLDAIRTLSRMRGTGQADLRLSCFFDCGNYFYVGGFPAAAIQTATQSMALAKQAGLRDWIRKAETMQGIIYADSGNVAEALVHYSVALDVARDIRDATGEAFVMQGIGVALNYAGLFREAIPVFHRACDIAAHIPDSYAVISRAHTNLALSYYYIDEFEKGLREIKLAVVGVTEPRNADDALSRTIKEATYVQLAIELEMRQTAIERANLCMKYAKWGGTPRSMLLANLTEAICMVFFGDADRGFARLEQCLAESEGVPPIRQRILVALVKCHDAIGNSGHALVYLQKLLGHIRRVREESVLQLLSIGESIGDQLSTTEIERSLMPLELRESKLRAKVAEAGLVAAQLEMLDRFAISADLREEESGEHGYRVGRLSSLLAEDLGWDRDACLALDVAARLHDIGKIGIPDRILLTSEELKEAERHLMSAHTIIGAELLAKSNIAQLRMAEEIARCHHEWWNGTGYPAKRSGNRIPIHARIVALADVFDAITHGRPYEQPWPADRAIAQIRRLRGVQFDPELTDRFLLLIDRLRSEHPDLDEYLSRAGRNSPFLQARQKIRQMIAMDAPTGTAVRGNETRH